MIFLPFIFCAALDMSLPEFQPDTDISGNYIIGEFDVSEGEFNVTELEELPDGLTVEAPSNDIISSDIVSEISLLQADDSTIITSTSISGRGIVYQNSHWIIKSKSDKTLHYVLLHNGIEYTIISGEVNYISSSIAVDTIVSSFSGSSITPNEDVYLLSTSGEFSVSYIDNSGGDLSGDDTSGNESDNPSGGDFDYTDLLVILNDIKMQLRCILFS